MKNLNDAVLEQFFGLMHHFKSQMHQALSTDNFELGPFGAQALAFFEMHPKGTQRDLIRYFGRDKAQVTRLLKQLEERGLISRELDAEDKRSHQIQLTAAGKALQATVHKHKQKIAEEMMVDFDAKERASLIELLGRMRSNIASDEDQSSN
ncbi:MarR family winged helix-turn-helix transcriptional regulator [Undibacterium terreum]|uniref:MarR family transcriptional regulator n=1 Tax=Undibacterium terreum TaxID=1224302 RepID=A0A916U440_9BURK|nr:MarR family transcriptional regulator [Undibacterium terreum]GGC58116.1 MarR family transcriptional regulator [Undibacterium terreum]